MPRAAFSFNGLEKDEGDEFVFKSNIEEAFGPDSLKYFEIQITSEHVKKTNFPIWKSSR